MCGRFNLIQSPAVQRLMEQLGIDASQLRFNADCAPCNPISIVIQDAEGISVRDAVWHLYLQPTAGGFKPHPDYWSINTNWRQLPKKPEFRLHRCLIPASSFIESQDGKHPHQLQFEGEAFCFGGLYKQWTHANTGETLTSAAIITLAGHPKLENIHRKSLPLIFNEQEPEQMALWLDPTQRDTSVFEQRLKPRLQRDLTAQPVDKSSTKKPTGPAFVLPAD